MKLDQEDKFYEIKLQTLKTERLTSLEATQKIDQKNEALRNQRVKSLIDIDEEYRVV